MFACVVSGTGDAFATALLAAHIQVNMGSRALDTFSANAYGAASNAGTSVSTSMTQCLSCTPFDRLLRIL